MTTPNHSQAPVVEDSAIEYAAIWQERARILAAERLRKLRTLSQRDAANLFAQLSSGRISPPASTSGLVEQQRIFERLR